LGEGNRRHIRSKVVRAERQQQDHRHRDTDGEEQDGAHDDLVIAEPLKSRSPTLQLDPRSTLRLSSHIP
jgi:hypothetical protein